MSTNYWLPIERDGALGYSCANVGVFICEVDYGSLAYVAGDLYPWVSILSVDDRIREFGGGFVYDSDDDGVLTRRATYYYPLGEDQIGAATAPEPEPVE